MKWEKLINWEHGFHINLRQTTYSKELAYVIFCCLDTASHKDHTRKRQWINPEDLPEPEPKNDLMKKVMLSVGGIEGLSTMNYVLIPRL